MLKFNPDHRPSFEELEENIDLKLYFNKILQFENFFDKNHSDDESE
jgi:hypothetical protein